MQARRSHSNIGGQGFKGAPCPILGAPWTLLGAPKLESFSIDSFYIWRNIRTYSFVIW